MWAPNRAHTILLQSSQLGMPQNKLTSKSPKLLKSHLDSESLSKVLHFLSKVDKVNFKIF